MSQVFIEEQYLSDIASAIRNKRSVTSTYYPSQMASAIQGIVGGEGIIPTGTFYTNTAGVFDITSYAKVDIDSYSLITPTGTSTISHNGMYYIRSFENVIVSVPNQGITPEGTYQISENGIYDISQYASVEVDIDTGIFPEGTYDITINGNYDITNYANVEVDVPASGITPTGVSYITTNGMYDISQYASASVNVPIGIFPEGTSNIVSNGLYTISSYYSVSVNVPGLVPTGTSNITSNGNYNISQYANVNVSVPVGIFPTGTSNITINGTYDISQYASVYVNVAGEEIDLTGTQWLLRDLVSQPFVWPEEGHVAGDDLTEDFSINFTTGNGNGFTNLNLFLFWDNNNNIVDYIDVTYQGPSGSGIVATYEYGEGGWADENNRIITITGGDDVSNPLLLKFLLANSVAELSGGGITPTGTSYITANGNYDISQYANVSVNVPIGYTAAQIASRDISGIIDTTDLTGATSIGSYAFYSCKSLTSVHCPTTIKSIYNSAFYSCTSLASFIAASATSLFGYAFAYCSKLKSVSFLSMVSIATYVFQYCSSLSTVTLGANISYIGNYAFRYCTRLVSLNLSRATKVPSLGGSLAFGSTPIGGYSTTAGQYGSIYVPTSLLASFKAATNWSFFSSRMVGV